MGTDNRPHVFSPIRSWDFDACVFIVFDAATYEIKRATEVPREGLRKLARPSAWLNAERVWTTSPFDQVPGACDLTAELRKVAAGLR